MTYNIEISNDHNVFLVGKTFQVLQVQDSGGKTIMVIEDVESDIISNLEHSNDYLRETINLLARA